MQLKIENLKYIKSLILVMVANVFCFGNLQAQEQIKVDGVAVVIGENIVLDSDITKFKKELETRSEGNVTISDCDMLEDIMLQKLMAHHAVQDSIIVTDAEVFGNVENDIAYLTSQLGSMERLIEFYGFNDESDLRDELKKIKKENLLVEREQAKIVENIQVTPEEVRIYFNSLVENEALPEFSSEVVLAQLVLNIEPSSEAVQEVKDRLNILRQEVLDGASFRMRAIMNSDDPAVTENGGKYEIERETNFVKEFKEAAFSLDVNEISEPFESDFGYHILQVEEIRGQKVIASHILIQPDVSSEELNQTKRQLEGIRTDILLGQMTFEEAVAEYSQDDNTKLSKGILMNTQTKDSRFDLTRMDPTLYARISNLNQGDMTDVFYDETRNGEKMYKIMMMVELMPSHQADMKQDYVKIQNLALQKKRQEEIDNWASEKIYDTYIKLNDSRKACNFKNNWSKN
jgi:peptidyl-prolyl cis-trans isomerase SurA